MLTFYIIITNYGNTVDNNVKVCIVNSLTSSISTSKNCEIIVYNLTNLDRELIPYPNQELIK